MIGSYSEDAAPACVATPAAWVFPVAYRALICLLPLLEALAIESFPDVNTVPSLPPFEGAYPFFSYCYVTSLVLVFISAFVDSATTAPLPSSAGAVTGALVVTAVFLACRFLRVFFD